jgi:catechol 2,3-dioxygenase-like lactoylglutathione lyase family enzyme
MKTSIHHVHLNVSNSEKSLPFYEALLKHLGYRIIDKSPTHIGASNGTTDLWLVQAEKNDEETYFHRKGAGLNHIAFRVSLRKDVVDFNRNFLKKRGMATLYGSPRLFPEYHKGYFAVYFEDPDRVKLEVVYIPKFRDRTKKSKNLLLLPKSANFSLEQQAVRLSKN